MVHTGLAFCAALLTNISPCGIAVRQSTCPQNGLSGHWIVICPFCGLIVHLDLLPVGRRFTGNQSQHPVFSSMI
jgi:hypothetical protein